MSIILSIHENALVSLWISMLFSIAFLDVLIVVLSSMKGKLIKSQPNTNREIIIVMLKIFYYLTAIGSLIILVLISAIKIDFVNPIITGTAILISVMVLTYITEIKLRANKKMLRDPSESLYT